MTATVSRNKTGTLTLDALPFAAQTSSVKLTPAVETEGDALELLDGGKLLPEESTGWTLDIVAVQDFTDEDGFVEYCRANAGDVVPFAWAPNGAGAGKVSYAGTCKIRAVDIGGAVNSRLDTSPSFPVESGPTPTYTP
jgi:hypothetical protein